MAEHGKAARERIEKDFSLKIMVAKYARLYDSLLDSKSLRDDQRAC